MTGEKKECRNCILVVDDAKIARELETLFLEHAGFEVIEASDGEEAIEKFIEFHPVLVILDLIMPKVSGMVALKKMKKIDPTAEILICTASDDYRVIDLALKEGAAGYIIKPYRGEELIQSIRTILSRHGNQGREE